MTMVKYIFLLIVMCSMSACVKTREVQEVHMRIYVDTTYVVTSTDGKECVRVSNPVPVKGSKLSCIWTSR